MSLLVLFAVGGMAQRVWGARAPLSASEVLQKALARTRQSQAGTGQPGYTYTKVSVTEKLDPAGRVEERKEKVYQVSSRAGATHVRLLEVNGHPPSRADVIKQAENEMTLRRLLGQSNSAQGNNHDSFLTPELVARFSFQLVGQATLNGRPAYQLAFLPREPEPPVHDLVDRLLDRVSGTLWIDAAEFEVAQAQIHLCSKVNLFGGALGCLRKLAYTMTRTRMADGLWLKSFSSGDFEGRKLFDSLRIKTQSHATNFRLMAMIGSN